MQEIRELQGYGYFGLVVFMVVLLYSYCYHLYKSEKTGYKDYEKYANLALDDELGSAILEQRRS